MAAALLGLPGAGVLAAGVWNNLGGFGLELHEGFRIVDNGGPSATCHPEVWVHNNTARPIGLAMVHYLDAEAAGPR